jgi:hypothetical protein
MNASKLFSTATAAIFAVLPVTALLGGCAAETSQDETAVATDDLSVSRLKGNWTSTTGPIYSIELTSKTAQSLGGFFKGHAFTAHVDNGVRCITTPCPNDEVVSGIYKTSGNKLTLSSYDKPGHALARILGEYTVTLSSVDTTLALDKNDAADAVHQTFTRGIPCGNNTCTGGTYCCNALRGMCAKPGVMCIQ